jgi:hypothetical protein
MSNHQFPSGPWVGFYTYSNRPRKHMMDLVLEFKNGKMTGDGADGIGFFVISGSYSEQSGECSWVKQYVGRHAVDYKGYREGKGIWGNWTLTGGRGGFHIWPLSEGAPLDAAKEKDENVEPAIAPA